MYKRIEQEQNGKAQDSIEIVVQSVSSNGYLVGWLVGLRDLGSMVKEKPEYNMKQTLYMYITCRVSTT